MDYRFFVYVDREETAKEDVTLKHYSDINTETNKSTVHTTTRKSGDGIIAQFYLDGHYETDERITNEQSRSISNAIKALILLKGEECVDERLITKFIKKATDIKVKNLKIYIATKTYTYSYRAGGKYQSDRIDLISHATKNI